ncbi:MAG TPA: lysylphosphatidylglycerol synthase transmembrane domain-containing protein [Ignavibacteriaceae bacterium]
MISDNSIKIPALRGIINFIISIGLAGLFLYIAFYDVNFGEVLSLVSEASIFWVLIFVVTIMLGHYIRALRWKYILHSVKPDIKMKNLFGALMVGYGVNCVTPKLGEVTRAIMIGNWEGLSRSSMFGTVIVERIIDVISLGSAVLISAFIWRENLYINFPWLESTLYFTGFLMLAVIILIYLTVSLKEKFYGVIVKAVSKISDKLAGKVAYIIEMLTQGFASLKGKKNYTYTIILTVLILAVYALTSYIGFFMLNMEPATYEMGWVLMSISAIGVVIPTPGGTGSYHTLAKSTLVLLFGFNETLSAAYAFLTHIISYFLFILTAVPLYFILNRQQTGQVRNNNSRVNQ